MIVSCCHGVHIERVIPPKGLPFNRCSECGRPCFTKEINRDESEVNKSIVEEEPKKAS